MPFRVKPRTLPAVVSTIAFESDARMIVLAVPGGGGTTAGFVSPADASAGSIELPASATGPWRSERGPTALPEGWGLDTSSCFTFPLDIGEPFSRARF